MLRLRTERERRAAGGGAGREEGGAEAGSEGGRARTHACTNNLVLRHNLSVHITCTRTRTCASTPLVRRKPRATDVGKRCMSPAKRSTPHRPLPLSLLHTHIHTLTHKHLRYTLHTQSLSLTSFLSGTSGSERLDRLVSPEDTERPISVERLDSVDATGPFNLNSPEKCTDADTDTDMDTDTERSRTQTGATADTQHIDTAREGHTYYPHTHTLTQSCSRE